MKNVSEKLFLLFVFLLPWQTVYLLREIFVAGEKWQYGTIGMYFSVLILGIFYISLLLRFLRYGTVRQMINVASYKSVSLAVCLFIWLLAQLLWAEDVTLALYKSILLLYAILLPFAVRYIQVDRHAIVTVFVSSLFLHAVIGLWQFFSQSTFSSTLLGIAHYESFKGGVSVIESETGRWLRAYGGFSHPNIFGGFMAVGALLSAGIWLEKRLSRSTFLHAGIAYAMTLLFFAGVLVSFSRSALLGFFFGLIVLIYFARMHFTKWFAWMTLGVGFLSVALVFYTQYGDLWQMRGGGESRLEQKSSQERISQFGESIELIKDHHVFGTGIGNYTRVLATENPKRPTWQIQPVHNVDLLIIVELGIIGGVLLGILLIIWLLDFFSIQKNQRNMLRISILACLSALCIPAMLDHWLWTSHIGVLVFGLLVALSVMHHTKKD